MNRLTSLFLFFFLSVLLLLTFLTSSGLAVATYPDNLKVSVLIAQVGGLLIPGLLLLRALRRRGLPLGSDATRRADPWRVALGVTAMTGTSLVFALALGTTWMNWLRTRGWDWVTTFVDFAEEAGVLFVAEGLVAKTLTLALVTLVPGLCEELVFRRLLLGVLLEAHGPIVATCLSALMFAAFHGDPLGFPHRFFLGLSLGLIYYRTSSLLACAASHAMFNAVVAWPPLFLEFGDASPPVAFTTVEMAAMSLLGLVGLSAWWATTYLLPRPLSSSTSLEEQDPGAEGDQP